MSRKNIFQKAKYFILGSAFFGIAANASEVIGQKWVALDHKGQAIVTVRKIEGKLGKPYTIELRVTCDKNSVKNWESLKVVDSEAVCDVKPKSAKLSKDGKYISVVIRETDAEAFNIESRKVDASALGELQPRCKEAGKEFMFSVEDYCRN